MSTPGGCEAKSGFFTLRPCGDAPVATCGQCGRHVCSRHLAGGPRAARCLDCDARARDAAAAPWEQSGRRWMYRYRRNQSGRYQGEVDGLYYDSLDWLLWSGSDYQAFERFSTADAADAEDGWTDDESDWSFTDS